MKTIIATTAIALSIAAAPAFADVSNAQAFFALSNDSAAERIVDQGSAGDTAAVRADIALSNDSAAERIVNEGSFATRGDTSAVRALIALGNDSAAERITR